MLIDDIRELAGDEVARKIAAKYGGTRPRVQTIEELDILERRNREICEQYYQAGKSMFWIQEQYHLGYEKVAKILTAAQP